MSVAYGPRVSVSRRKACRQQQAARRRRPFFEALEDRRVLAPLVTWDVQSDIFGVRNAVSQPRSMRSLALSGDDQTVYAGFINGTSTTAIRAFEADINTSLIGNGTSTANDLAPNPVYNEGVIGFASPGVQPRSLATDDRGNVFAALSSTSNNTANSWTIYSPNLGSVVFAGGSTNASASQLFAVSVVKLGGSYYAYFGWKNGLIERWNVDNVLAPTLDTSWGAVGTPGKINLKSHNAAAYMNGMEVDSDGTIYVAGGLISGTSYGDSLIKIPAAGAADGSLAGLTSVTVGGGAAGTPSTYGAMDVALYAGKAYVTQYLEMNSTISVFYKHDLSSYGNITPPIASLAGPSGLVSATNLGELAYDRGFAGIDISADGRIYLGEQLYHFEYTYTPTNPGAVSITDRIYFDRILVSSVLDAEGPVTSNVVATPNPATAGFATEIILTATINDTSTSGSTIAGAEYSVDGGSTWLPMQAADGTFDTVTEDVVADFTLGSAGFDSPGSYPIQVRGIDTASQTGAADSVTLEVEGVAPSITSAITTTFTVGVFGNFIVTTDADPTAAISYSGSLPLGVSLVDNGDGTATLSGTPAVGTQGTYDFDITASNGVAPDAEQPFTLVVNPPPVDYGDAPDTYGTLFVSNGARHTTMGPTLGATRDSEADGQPNGDASGDGADEDGVQLPSTLYGRLGAEITVTASAAARLDAWIDFDRDGEFEAGEQIFNGLNVVAGANTLSLAAPGAVVPGASYARFRLSTAGGLSPTGAAVDGEVEDYPVTLAAFAPGSATVVADPENPGESVLVVQGTNYFYETIAVQPTAGQPGKVTASISPGTSVAGIDLASFSRIVIFGEGGLDSITIGGAITKPSTIYGDAGFDTISGGGGPDLIFGGADYDSLSGNAGDDVFVSEAGADSINGGANTDTIVKVGSGTFTLSNSLLSVGYSYVSISGIENAQLLGGAGPDTFILSSWTGNAYVNGGGGTNVLSDTADGNFTLLSNSLTRTVGSTTTTIPFDNIQSVNLTGGFGNNTFDLTGWSGPAIISGGYFGNDTIIANGNVDYTLSDVMLLRPSQGMIRLSGIENAVLTGGGNPNTFNLSNWSNAATLNGAGGSDKLQMAGNVNFTLSDTSLTRSTGGALTLSSIEQAELVGGTGNNTISAATFSGTVLLDGGAGNDTLTGGSGASLLLGGTGNDTLQSGSGRTLQIGGVGLDKLTGSSNGDLLIDGTTTHDNSTFALMLLLSEWASASSYSDRVAHLTGSAGGLNGSTNLGGSNVIHDSFVDVLLGAGDDDLFFAKLDNPFLDSLGDKTGGESAI